MTRPLRRPAALATLALLAALPLAGCLGGPDGSTPSPPTPTGLGPPASQDPRFGLEAIATGLESPVLVTHAGDGSGRLFIVEQVGVVRVWKDGTVLGRAFLDLRDRVACCGERGLLGLAFEPEYATTGRFYVHYTDENGDTVVARYAVDASDPNRAAPETARTILTQEQPQPNHNGGMLAFGPDGYLYLGLGDGGGAGDVRVGNPQGNGQDTGALLGKILRLDVVGQETYRVPATNPFADGGGRGEVWAYGLRNPWRFSFDRATGDLWIGDVGQNAVEEIDYQPRASAGGENYGWNVWEGSRRFRPGNAEGAVFPVAEYSHDSGGCSVTGGYVYRGERVPALHGVYLFADYCSGQVWGVTPEDGTWRMREVRTLDFRVSSFGEGEDGEVYVVDHGGSVHRLVPERAG